jgi:hypothetical protein
MLIQIKLEECVGGKDQKELKMRSMRNLSFSRFVPDFFILMPENPTCKIAIIRRYGMAL